MSVPVPRLIDVDVDLDPYDLAYVWLAEKQDVSTYFGVRISDVPRLRRERTGSPRRTSRYWARVAGMCGHVASVWQVHERTGIPVDELANWRGGCFADFGAPHLLHASVLAASTYRMRGLRLDEIAEKLGILRWEAVAYSTVLHDLAERLDTHPRDMVDDLEGLRRAWDREGARVYVPSDLDAEISRRRSLRGISLAGSR